MLKEQTFLFKNFKLAKLLSLVEILTLCIIFLDYIIHFKLGKSFTKVYNV